LRPKAKRLGFVSLESEGEIFRFRSVKGFSRAVTESIASLELLADLLEQTADSEEAFDSAYSRLKRIYEA
jgi:hypothetical protein